MLVLAMIFSVAVVLGRYDEGRFSSPEEVLILWALPPRTSSETLILLVSQTRPLFLAVLVVAKSV